MEIWLLQRWMRFLTLFIVYIFVYGYIFHMLILVYNIKQCHNFLEGSLVGSVPRSILMKHPAICKEQLPGKNLNTPHFLSGSVLYVGLKFEWQSWSNIFQKYIFVKIAKVSNNNIVVNCLYLWTKGKIWEIMAFCKYQYFFCKFLFSISISFLSLYWIRTCVNGISISQSSVPNSFFFLKIYILSKTNSSTCKDFIIIKRADKHSERGKIIHFALSEHALNNFCWDSAIRGVPYFSLNRQNLRFLEKHFF